MYSLVQKHNIYLVAMTALYSVTLNKAKHSPPHAAWHPTSCRTHSSDSILYLYCMYCTRTSSPWHSLLKKWRTQERPLARREVDRPWRDRTNSTSRVLLLAFYREDQYSAVVLYTVCAGKQEEELCNRPLPNTMACFAL